jgi:hypothetical protein
MNLSNMTPLKAIQPSQVYTLNETVQYVEGSTVSKIITRNETAEKVQKILTGLGCYIKTCLGIHDGVLDHCTDTGLVFIELVGERRLTILKFNAS